MGKGREIIRSENRKRKRGGGDTPRPVEGNWSQLKLGLGENGRILDPFAS